MSFKILGTGSALPKRVITNNEMSTIVETSDEWIRTRTGIEERHVLDGDETVTSIALEAVEKALENAGIDGSEIDYVLGATISGEFLTPSLSSLVQAAIGADCPAMDIVTGCSGFLYAMEVAAGIMARGRSKKMLIVAAEGLSRVCNFEDRTTCVLFGDGAGAVVIEPGDNLLALQLSSRGWSEPLYIPYPSGNLPGRAVKEESFIHMNGKEVYKFAVNAIVNGITGVLKETGIPSEKINHVLLHQANLRIIEAAQKKLDIPNDRYAINIPKVGNLSAASIPLLLDLCNRKGRFKKDDILVLSAFGAGLTTGSAVLRW